MRVSSGMHQKRSMVLPGGPRWLTKTAANISTAAASVTLVLDLLETNVLQCLCMCTGVVALLRKV